MTPTPFDFQNPPPGELERQVAEWLTATCRVASASWTDRLCYPVEVRPGAIVPGTAIATWRAIAEPSLGFSATLASPAVGHVLFTLHRPLMLGLITGLLGETPTALPDDREPGDLESSLFDYIARDFFLDPLEKGWPLADPPRLTAGPTGAPRSVWRGATSDRVLSATLLVSTPFGEYPIALILSRSGPWTRLAEAPRRDELEAPFDRTSVETVVRAMQVDLSVVLGTADTTMSELAQLQAGDVIVLRQRVGEPLDGFVSGAHKFRVWPGAIGLRAAVQVQSQVEQ